MTGLAYLFVSWIILSLVLGLIFSSVYERVEIGPALVSLFAVVALAVVLLAQGFWRYVRRPRR